MIMKAGAKLALGWTFVVVLFASCNAFAEGCKIDAVKSVASSAAYVFTTSGDAFEVPGQDFIDPRLWGEGDRLLICPIKNAVTENQFLVLNINRNEKLPMEKSSGPVNEESTYYGCEIDEIQRIAGASFVARTGRNFRILGVDKLPSQWRVGDQVVFCPDYTSSLVHDMYKVYNVGTNEQLLGHEDK
jgi:hypothetical protein